MTVREFANDLLDLQLWQAGLVWVGAIFGWVVGRAVAKGVIDWMFSSGPDQRKLKGERGSSG